MPWGAGFRGSCLQDHPGAQQFLWTGGRLPGLGPCLGYHPPHVAAALGCCTKLVTVGVGEGPLLPSDRQPCWTQGAQQGGHAPSSSPRKAWPCPAQGAWWPCPCQICPSPGGEGRGQGAVCAACSPRSPCPWAEGRGTRPGGAVCAACSPIAPVPRQRGQAWGCCVCSPRPWAEGCGLGALLPALAPDSAATGWGNSDFSTEPTPTPASAKPWVFLSEPWSLPGGGAGSWPRGPHSPCTGPCLGG